MKPPAITTTYAFRSLWRHRRRTLLSIAGIALGCGLCLFLVGFVRGEGKMLLRAAAESGAGHLRVVPAGWVASRDKQLRIGRWQALAKQLEAEPNVKVVAPRARHDGLLGFGIRQHGLELWGVDPVAERQTNRLVRSIADGRYLEPDEEGVAVVGKAVAERLDAGLGDPLMVTVAQADGTMNAAMLEIVGIVATGSQDMDLGICHVSRLQLEHLTGLTGAGELTILLDDPEALVQTQNRIARSLPADCQLVTWREIIPELAAGERIDHASTRLLVAIVILVVFLGIASAQLAAALERRREFAVLAALGMGRGRLVTILLAEALILGLFGTAGSLAIGVPATYYIATRGIDFTRMYQGMDLSVSNILIDPVFYGDFGWWLIPLAFLLALSATALSSVYPAWYASRTEPANALRVEN